MKRLGHWAALSGGLMMAMGLLASPAHASGQTLTMEATAYGPSAADNYPYGPTDYFGQPLVAGDVAVDPSVIPLRTCLRITGYHNANLPAGGFVGEADDEGGAIKGMHVDLFMNANPTAVSNFGIQTVHVTILGPAKSNSLSGTAACASYASSLGTGSTGSGSAGSGVGTKSTGANSGSQSSPGTSHGVAQTSTGFTGSNARTIPVGRFWKPILVGLQPGMTGRPIYTLQADLELLGFKGVSMSGSYDSATVSGVSAFERQVNLPVGGATTMAFRNAVLKALRGTPASGTTTSTTSGTPSTVTTTSAVSGTRAAIVQQALAELGHPYVWGGTSPAGFDCSGLVQWVFAREGIKLPRLSGQQYRFGTPISKTNLEPGDLVFFQTYKPGPSHVGIYIGAYQGIQHAFVAADNPSVGVRIDNLDSAKWVKLYYGAARILPAATSVSATVNTAKSTPSTSPTSTPTVTTTSTPSPSQAISSTSGNPQTIDGRPVLKVIHMIATAYGPSLKDNYPYGPVDAFGQPLQTGMVAVDPSVIPLKTYVYVSGYTDSVLPSGGFLGHAMDTGGAIKGNRIDIFMNDNEETVSNFGIEPVTVYVLGN